jgi:hypothetical protein
MRIFSGKALYEARSLLVRSTRASPHAELAGVTDDGQTMRIVNSLGEL